MGKSQTEIFFFQKQTFKVNQLLITWLFASILRAGKISVRGHYRSVMPCT